MWAKEMTDLIIEDKFVNDDGDGYEKSCHPHRAMQLGRRESVQIRGLLFLTLSKEKFHVFRYKVQ